MEAARSRAAAGYGETHHSEEEGRIKRPVLRLILSKPPVSDDTVACLEELLDDARRGKLVGMAFAAQYADRQYVIDSTGEAYSDPTYARGMISALHDLLGRRARGDT